MLKFDRIAKKKKKCGCFCGLAEEYPYFTHSKSYSTAQARNQSSDDGRGRFSQIVDYFSSPSLLLEVGPLTPLPSVNLKGRAFRGGYFVAAVLCSTMQYGAQELTGLFSVTIYR